MLSRLTSTSIATAATAACLAALLAAGGCTTQKTSNRPAEGSTYMQDDTTGTRATATTRADTPARTSSWPTQRGAMWSSMAYPTGDPRTSGLGIEKGGYPEEIRPGQTFNYQIIVTNLTSRTLSDVVVTDTPEEYLELKSSDPRGRMDAGGTATWTFDELGPREVRTINVSAVATRVGTVGSCATVSYASMLCTSVPVVSPELELVKSGPAEVLMCEPIRYTLEVSNTGTGTVRGVRITDDLPDGLVAEGNRRTLSMDIGDLGPGQSVQRTAIVRAERTGRFENVAKAMGSGDLTVESGTVATLVRAPKLEITKSCEANDFIGRPSDIEITVRNVGDGPAREAMLEESLGAGGRVLSADGGRMDGNRAVWNLGTLDPDEEITVRAQVTNSTATRMRATSTARAYCADPVTDECMIEYTGIPAILLEVTDVEDPVRVGQNTTYRIVVTNQGTKPATGVRVACTLEPSQEYVRASGASQATARGREITFAPIASIPAAGRAELLVVVKCVEASGDTRFKVELNSDQLTRPVEETEATYLYE